MKNLLDTLYQVHACHCSFSIGRQVNQLQNYQNNLSHKVAPVSFSHSHIWTSLDGKYLKLELEFADLHKGSTGTAGKALGHC